MSIFARPDSPPPRAPSPDILPEPLPCHRHPRRVASQPRVRVHSRSPAVPPGLYTRTKTLHSARSAEVLSIKSSDDGHSIHSLRPKTRTTLAVYDSPRSTPSHSPSPSPSSSSRNSPDFTPRHRRTFSVVMSHPSASPNTTSDSLLPPVPSVPSVYKGPKHIICPKPVSYTPIYLPDIEELSNPSNVPPPATTAEQKSPSPPPPLEKHRSMGVACLKFFGIRTTNRQQQHPPVVSL